MFIAPRAPNQSPAPEERNVSDDGTINQALHSAPTELPKYFVSENLKTSRPYGTGSAAATTL